MTHGRATIFMKELSAPQYNWGNLGTRNSGEKSGLFVYRKLNVVIDLGNEQNELNDNPQLPSPIRGSTFQR